MNTQPKFASFDTWTAVSGLSRSKTYLLLGENKLRAVKVGGRTLIDVDHGLAFLAAQPAAIVRGKRLARAA